MKSLYEQLRDADKDIQKKEPVVWLDTNNNQNQGEIK